MKIHEISGFQVQWIDGSCCSAVHYALSLKRTPVVEFLRSQRAITEVFRDPYWVVTLVTLRACAANSLGALEAQQSTGCCSIFAESYTGRGEGTVDWIFGGVPTSWILIDLRPLAAPWMNPVIPGISYQPQLGRDFFHQQNITGITESYMLARQEGCCGAVHRGADSLRNMQAWYISDKFIKTIELRFQRFKILLFPCESREKL